MDIVIVPRGALGRCSVRFGFDNYPNQWLALAFVLARLGEGDEAASWFEKFLSARRPSEACTARLRRLFSEAESAA